MNLLGVAGTRYRWGLGGIVAGHVMLPVPLPLDDVAPLDAFRLLDAYFPLWLDPLLLDDLDDGGQMYVTPKPAIATFFMAKNHSKTITIGLQYQSEYCCEQEEPSQT